MSGIVILLMAVTLKEWLYIKPGVEKYVTIIFVLGGAIGSSNDHLQVIAGGVAVPLLIVVSAVMLNVYAGDSFNPVPAEYVIGALNWTKVNAVVPTVIGSGVC